MTKMPKQLVTRMCMEVGHLECSRRWGASQVVGGERWEAGGGRREAVAMRWRVGEGNQLAGSGGGVGRGPASGTRWLACGSAVG